MMHRLQAALMLCRPCAAARPVVCSRSLAVQAGAQLLHGLGQGLRTRLSIPQLPAKPLLCRCSGRLLGLHLHGMTRSLAD